MPDIFISYSRQDSEQALHLVERLRSHGLTIWLDQRNIAGAEHWGAEIVEGIHQCYTFLLLVSPASTSSDQVLKELTIASEKRKRILPVELLPTEIPTSFQYALAGLQRVAISDFDGILRAHKHGLERVAVRDTRKSLMVLPFEDLSPASEDNAWFADGLTSELINSLSCIKSLRIPDRRTSMDLKGFRGKTMEIARELDIRYFIEGNVRKFGDQIKISIELLDIESGDYLWQHSYKGQFKDIFDIQEEVAQKVVLGLKLHLSTEERSRIADRGTESAEAYELYIKAREFLLRQTKEGFELGIQLLDQTIAIDPTFADAYRQKASALAAKYRGYDRNPALLAEAESIAQKALELKPDLYAAYHALSHVYLHQGRYEEAENVAKEFVKKDPENFLSHATLAFFYGETSQHEKAIAPMEETVRLRPDYIDNILNLAMACDEAGHKTKAAEWAAFGLPQFERYLNLYPEDEAKRNAYAALLFWSGNKAGALKEAEKLKANARDGFSLYGAACLFGDLQEARQAIEVCQKAVEAGYHDVLALNHFLQNNLFDPLRDSTEFHELERVVKEIES